LVIILKVLIMEGGIEYEDELTSAEILRRLPEEDADLCNQIIQYGSA
jgi:hypothetical protein